MTKAPGGIPGLETMLPLPATCGVAAGRIIWSRLVEVCCANPARIFGLRNKGRLIPGADADAVIYDPRVQSEIRADKLHNRAGYTPFPRGFLNSRSSPRWQSGMSNGAASKKWAKPFLNDAAVEPGGELGSTFESREPSSRRTPAARIAHQPQGWR